MAARGSFRPLDSQTACRPDLRPATCSLDRGAAAGWVRSANGLMLNELCDTEIPPVAEELGEGGPPRIYYTEELITDRSYVFSIDCFNPPATRSWRCTGIGGSSSVQPVGSSISAARRRRRGDCLRCRNTPSMRSRERFWTRFPFDNEAQPLPVNAMSAPLSGTRSTGLASRGSATLGT